MRSILASRCVLRPVGPALFGLLVGGLSAAAFAVFVVPANASDQAAETARECWPKQAARAYRVARVIDGQTLQLETGAKVRLIGALPPFPRRWRAFDRSSLSAKAKRALQEIVRGRRVKLAVTGRPKDRYGRLLAHVWVLEETKAASGRAQKAQNMIWVQGELIRQGLARVYSFPDNRACVRQLLDLEARARRNRLGIWRTRFAFAVRDAARPHTLYRYVNRFEIVEGRVHKVAHTRKWSFLNFAENWKQDFTLMVPARARRRFKRAGIDLDKLAGRRVRARGWLEIWNGPLLKLTHPEQLELLPKPEPFPISAAFTESNAVEMDEINALLPDLPKSQGDRMGMTPATFLRHKAKSKGGSR